MEIEEFLIARADELDAQTQATEDWALIINVNRMTATLRAMLKWHEDFPVLVETRPELSVNDYDPQNLISYTMQMSKHINWMTTKQYIEKFGTKPPTSPLLKTYASCWSTHHDFNRDWLV